MTKTYVCPHGHKITVEGNREIYPVCRVDFCDTFMVEAKPAKRDGFAIYETPDRPTSTDKGRETNEVKRVAS